MDLYMVPIIPVNQDSLRQSVLISILPHEVQKLRSIVNAMSPMQNVHVQIIDPFKSLLLFCVFP